VAGELAYTERFESTRGQAERLLPMVDRALSRAGLPPFKHEKVQQQLRHLGPRAVQLYDWLLEADLALKSSAGLPPRAVIERLLVRLAGGKE